MKVPTILIALLSMIHVSDVRGQFCIPGRFDTTTFAMSQIDSLLNVKYGQNYNWQDTAIQNLKMDVYFPKSSVDPLAKRPLIVMIHAGGFYLGTRQSYRYYCREFAKRGFVAATIDYRIGWDFGLGQHYEAFPLSTQISYPFKCEGDATSSIKALYRALQDQKAAIRFLVHNADTVINIDTDYIFAGGGSAGGVSSLGIQYLQQEFFDTEFPNLHLQDSLGPLDFATNSLLESFSLAGIINMWGAVPDTSLITASNSLPTLLIHCTGDTLVPCISSNFYSCPNYVVAQGSCVISERLKNLNQCYEFNFFDATHPFNGCHDVYTKDYHIERISKFAKRVFCDDCRQITIENQIEIGNDTLITSVSTVLSNKEESIILYPNPAHSHLKITSRVPIKRISIYTVFGESVNTAFYRNRIVDLAINRLEAGIYIFEIENTKGEVVTKKVMINN